MEADCPAHVGLTSDPTDRAARIQCMFTVAAQQELAVCVAPFIVSSVPSTVVIFLVFCVNTLFIMGLV